jgi:hypothetical protein
MSKSEDPSFYRRSFTDIVRGFTRQGLNEAPLYIKHLTTHDQVDLEAIEQEFFDKAKERGLYTEADRLKALAEDGSWSNDDEKFIETQKSFIENLIKSKNQLILKSQADLQQKSIDKESEKLDDKLAEKNALIGSTCESYAAQRVKDFYISKSFFKDEFLKNPIYTEEEFDELSYTEVSELVKLHNKQFKQFSEVNIQKLVLEDFYFPYMPFSEDTMQFFGKSVCELTHNQLKLILYTRIFKNIFDNSENIPEKIRKDPQALLDFASSSKEGKEKLDEHNDKGGASTLVGATKEDYEYMGVEPQTVSLHDAAKKKGGSLNMQDLMDLAGE